MSTIDDRALAKAWEELVRFRSELGLDMDMSYELSIAERNKLVDWDEYYCQVIESDGFYVDTSKSHNTMVGITPCYFNNEDKDDICIILAKFAIDTFNHRRLSFKDTHGELKFVTLLNATGESCCGTTYYLTFNAMNLDNGNTYTYQATVHNSVSNLPDLVEAFRLKPAPGSTKTWFWNDPCCGDEEIVSEEKSGEGVPPRAETPTSIPYSRYSEGETPTSIPYLRYSEGETPTSIPYSRYSEGETPTSIPYSRY